MLMFIPYLGGYSFNIHLNFESNHSFICYSIEHLSIALQLEPGEFVTSIRRTPNLVVMCSCLVQLNHQVSAVVLQQDTSTRRVISADAQRFNINTIYLTLILISRLTVCTFFRR